MHIVKVSPKGQITLPKKARKECGDVKQYAFEIHGKIIVLRPVKIEPLDELINLPALAEKSFDFWKNGEDDIYQTFYTK